MLTEIKTEMIYQIPLEENALKTHFKNFYKCFCKENSNRFISGIPSPSLNARLDTSKSIEEDIQFFQSRDVPFCWYIDDDTDAAFEEKLLAAQFIDLGVFKGMSAPLTHLFSTAIKEGYTVELIEDETSMKAFADLICPIFEITGEAAGQYQHMLWEHPRIYNWALKKEGKVVSGLSTYIEGAIVSLWNVATAPELRRLGHSSILLRVALNDALSKGCHTAMAYLTSEGMALGICKALGFETKWQFHTYLSPLKSSDPQP